MKGVCFTCRSAMHMAPKKKKFSGHFFQMINNDYKLLKKRKKKKEKSLDLSFNYFILRNAFDHGHD